MHDISDLLQAAARDSRTGPDLQAVAVRARYLRRRQTVLRAGSLTAVVLLAVPLIDRGHGAALQQLHQDDVPGTVSSAHPTSTPRANRNTTTHAVRIVANPSPTPAGAQPTPGATSETRATLAPRSPGPAATSGAGYPAASSCQVTTRDVASGPSWSCSFTATKTGGWRLTRGAAVFVGYTPATLHVRVQRGQTITDYDINKEAKDCADNVIRVGDRVLVSIESRSTSHVEDLELGAGVGYGC